MSGPTAGWQVAVIDDWDGVAPSVAELDALAEHATVQVVGGVGDDELVARCGGAHILIPIRERRTLRAELLARFPNLCHLAQTGGAAAHVDRAHLRARGVSLSLTPGASAISVAELVIALAVCVRRGVVASAADLADGVWNQVLGQEVSGTRMGVVGFGAAGRAVAERAAALGMDVMVCSRRAEAGRIDGWAATASLPAVCEWADVVSIHVELSDATRGLVDREHLRLLGADGLLINTARAAIVDRDGLRHALERGELGSAALDVHYEEPVHHPDPIADHPRVLATAHIGWRTVQSQQRYLAQAARNARDFILSGATDHDEPVT